MPDVRTTSVVILSLSLAVTACRTQKPGEPEPPLPALEALIRGGARPPYLSRGARGERVWKTARTVYAERGYRPLWTQPDSRGHHRKPLPQMDELVHTMEHADRDGLVPDDYEAASLRELRDRLWDRDARKGFDANALAQADVQLTCMFLEYAADLAGGRVDPRAIDRQWVEKPRDIHFAAALTRALASEGVTAVLADLAPKHAEYRALRDVLSTYRDIRDRGGWPKVPTQLTLKPGNRHPAVPAIRARLALSGDLGADSASRASDTRTDFDEPLERALVNFQTRHGITPTGTFTPETAAAMNVPVERRMQQIAVNMERWRWLPDRLGDRYLRVNLPAFRLDVFEHGRSVMTQRVIVGKDDSRTPIFSDEMRYVVFSPYWNIPDRIVRDETIPRAIADPAFLERNNIEVVGTSGETIDPASIDWANAATDSSLRFRQKPGADNSLGLVKFIFPNHFNVYLHDTPADALFTRIDRDFSHGCMRVEQPLALAQYVLRDQPEWTTERMEAAMHAGKERTVKLTAPLPVHVVYFTVMPYENGAVQFRDDLYGYDAIQLKLTVRKRGR